MLSVIWREHGILMLVQCWCIIWNLMYSFLRRISFAGEKIGVTVVEAISIPFDYYARLWNRRATSPACSSIRYFVLIITVFWRSNQLRRPKWYFRFVYQMHLGCTIVVIPSQREVTLNAYRMISDIGSGIRKRTWKTHPKLLFKTNLKHNNCFERLCKPG